MEIVGITTPERKQQQVSLEIQLQDLGYNFDWHVAEQINGSVRAHGKKYAGKKLALLRAWAQILRKYDGAEHLLVLEDDVHLHGVDEISKVIKALDNEFADKKTNLVALGGKGVDERDYPSIEYAPEDSDYRLIAGKWTGNIANLVTEKGINWLAKRINGADEHMLKLIYKHKAIDLTWSMWPGFYRLAEPLAIHIDKEYWSE